MFETLQKYLSEREKTKFNEEIPKPAKKIRRNFEASKINRLTNSWVTQPTSVNQALRSSLLRLRERSRDAARNDTFAKKFFSLNRTNLIGKNGITFQINAGDDKKFQIIAKDVEDKFKIWAKKRFCTSSQKMSWRQAQRYFVTALARDGEVVVRKIFDSSNPFGFSLKFYGAEWLDENYYATASNGNLILMGVEFDKLGRPVAYHFTPPMGDWTIQNRERFRVEASEILHCFLVLEAEDQARGVPHLHASLLRLNMLDGYEEAELIGRRIGASNMGFFIPHLDQDAASYEDKNETFELIDEVEPGAFKELPAGYDFKEFNPKQPDSTGNDFKKTVLGGIAAGGDVAKHSLTGDMTEVNYSSARIALLQERDTWTMLQQDIIEDFCEPVFEEWLKSAWLSGQLQLTQKDYDKILSSVKWFPRGWSWIDPEKETKADVLGISSGIQTVTSVLAEKGIDLEEFLKERQKEQELFERYNVPYPSNANAGSQPNDENRYGALKEDFIRRLE